MYTTTVPILIDTPFEKKALLKDLLRCKVDRIALALNREMEHRFSSPSNMARLKEMLEYFKENGLQTIVWIGETLGHDQVTLFPEGCEEPYRRMKLPGKGTVASFCPTDERLVRDLCKWVASVAKLKPDLILLDDDYRINGGCMCDAHVARMNRELGEELTGKEFRYAGYLNGYALRRMLTEQTAWLNRKPLDAYADGNYPNLYTMVKKGEHSLSVGLWNLFEDKIHGLTVKVNGEYASARFVNCEGKFEKGCITLSSVLYPYEFAGIELS